MTKELERTPLADDDRTSHWTVRCRKCGKALTLYYNGGELDMTQCCDLLYTLESRGTDLVIIDPNAK